MKLIYLKFALKADPFDVTIGVKISFFIVSITIEPGRSLLNFVTTICLMYKLFGHGKVNAKERIEKKVLSLQ